MFAVYFPFCINTALHESSNKTWRERRERRKEVERWKGSGVTDRQTDGRTSD